MLKNQSIFKKLIINMIPLWIIPFFIILSLLYYYTCLRLRNDEHSFLQDKMNAYVQDINTTKNSAVTKSDYIVNNSEIRDSFEFNSDVLYYKLINTDKITKYISVISENGLGSITIYTDNPSIMTSQFTDSITNLDNRRKVEEKLQKFDQIFFDDTVYTNDLGDQYLVLYRRFIGKQSIIIEIKAYLPERDGFSVEKNDPKFASNKYICVAVTNELSAVTRFDTEVLHKKYLWYALAFLVCGILFCVFIISASFVITTKTTQTINDYISTLSTDNTSESNYDDGNESKDSWELKTIKDAINKLIEENNQKARAQYTIELEKKRLELDLLQSKIDPHILYNSLAAISLKAYKNKDDELTNLIVNLTDYYRSVLAQGRDFTTVEEEVELILKFVKVNEISHSQFYHFSSEIDESTRDHKLIHLLLQPFVENSIVHGLAGKPEPCIIRLRCYKKNDRLIFEIYDNGYGIAPQKLSELNNLMEYQENYAIRNTLERLRLFYSEDSSIRFESKLNEYTLVTINIKDI